ncbi:MAG: hypothetical protein BGN96_05335 [Bacteroidales bacterium 45-6]|nr:MAG: hypothetical protein BGN96_05335 [Bacteroidales bacterium 45-6]
MKNELLPTRFEGIEENVYAGFWVRVAARLLDFVILLPIAGLVLYVNNISKSAYMNMLLPNLLFALAFEVILVKVYGGTPGKLIMGLKIIRKDGDSVDWKTSFFRYSVQFTLGILSAYVLFLTLSLIDDNAYNSAGFLQKSQLLSKANPGPMQIPNILSLAWYIAGTIVLLSNSRKRTTHDFIAGTVVVKAAYLDKIREAANDAETEEPTAV